MIISLSRDSTPSTHPFGVKFILSMPCQRRFVQGPTVLSAGGENIRALLHKQSNDPLDIGKAIVESMPNACDVGDRS